MVDYNLQPKGCFYYLKRAYANDLVGYVQQYAIDYGPDANSHGKLFVASERGGNKAGVVELRVVRVDGQVLETQQWPVRLNGRGAVSLGDVVLPDYKARRFDCVAEFALRWEDGTTARNVYTFSRPKHMKLPAPKIVLTQAGPSAIDHSPTRKHPGLHRCSRTPTAQEWVRYS